MAQIIIPTPLRKFTSNEAKLNFNGSSVLELLNNLVAKYPDLEPYILDGTKVKPFIKLFKGDQDIESLEKEETAISENDILSIIPAIAGGIS